MSKWNAPLRIEHVEGQDTAACSELAKFLLAQVLSLPAAQRIYPDLWVNSLAERLEDYGQTRTNKENNYE